MSPSTVGSPGPSRPNDLLQGGFGPTPNETVDACSENAQLEVGNFGIFNVEVRKEVQNLQNGLSTVDGAITALTKVFDKHEKVVKAVGGRYDQDTPLEQEIRDLNLRNGEIWKHIKKDREAYESQLLEINRQHEAELVTLRMQADAGAREKAKYEQMEIQLADEHDKQRESVTRELQQKRIELERKNSAKIAALEQENVHLAAAQARLKIELGERITKLEKNKDILETMLKDARSDNKDLEKSLHAINVQYEMEYRPSHFYADQYQSLFDRIDKIATTYFTDLPATAMEDSKGVSTRLSRTLPSFENVPIAQSDSAVLLRVANVQNLVFNVLDELAMNPFFSLHQWTPSGDNLYLKKIYSHMAQYGEDVQRRWKVSTTRTLEQLDASMDVSGTVGLIVDLKLVAPLYELLNDDDQADKFKSDLKWVFISAIELSRKAESDKSPVCVDMSPSVSDRAGWQEYSTEKFETKVPDDLVRGLSNVHIRHEPLCVQPKIYRRTRQATTTVPSPAATRGGTEIEVIRRGVALFPETGIFQDGALLWQKIRYAGMEVARSGSGKGKPHSRSTSLSINTSLVGRKS